MPDDQERMASQAAVAEALRSVARSVGSEQGVIVGALVGEAPLPHEQANICATRLRHHADDLRYAADALEASVK
jgi:hypothetical protein